MDYRSFYREWNLLVHDWIYCYIYQDLRSVCCKLHSADLHTVLQLLGSKYTAISVFATTFMSSLFHEYIIATGMKFFLPLLTIEFSGFGGTVQFLYHPQLYLCSPLQYYSIMSGLETICQESFWTHCFSLDYPLGLVWWYGGMGLRCTLERYVPKRYAIRSSDTVLNHCYLFLAFICKWNVAKIFRVLGIKAAH